MGILLISRLVWFYLHRLTCCRASTWQPTCFRDGNLWVVVIVKELCQQTSWLLIGCTGVNNQSEARKASWPNSWQWLKLIRFRFRCPTWSTSPSPGSASTATWPTALVVFHCPKQCRPKQVIIFSWMVVHRRAKPLHSIKKTCAVFMILHDEFCLQFSL